MIAGSLMQSLARRLEGETVEAVYLSMTPEERTEFIVEWRKIQTDMQVVIDEVCSVFEDTSVVRAGTPIILVTGSTITVQGFDIMLQDDDSPTRLTTETRGHRFEDTCGYSPDAGQGMLLSELLSPATLEWIEKKKNRAR